MEMTPEAPVRLQIDRPAGRLQYRLGLNPNAGPNGSPWDVMTWLPEYRAEGTLVIGNRAKGYLGQERGWGLRRA